MIIIITILYWDIGSLNMHTRVRDHEVGEWYGLLSNFYVTYKNLMIIFYKQSYLYFIACFISKDILIV